MAIPRLCSIDGCGKRHFARGWCQKHYMRVRYDGTLDLKNAPHGARQGRVEAALQYEGNDCQTWPFKLDAKGYGQKLIYGGRNARPHRIICELAHGGPPSPKHEAAHSCGNAACVTKAHLSWKTSKENAADKVLHGTTARGERIGKGKLTEAAVREIRAMKGKVGKDELARKFGVSAGHIYRVQRGRWWNHIS